MAIAALVFHIDPAALEKVLPFLRAAPEILDAQIVQPERIAASLETPAGQLLDCLTHFRQLAGVEDLELVYVNYEDDLDSEGRIECGSLVEIKRKLGLKQ